MTTTRAPGRVDAREVLGLAVPALLALVTEPLFLLADNAIVGRLGTAPLAALGVAGIVVQGVVGLCVFLAYGTTGTVARHVGAGDTAGALRVGVDGAWLAGLLGVVLTALTALLAPWLVGLFDLDPQVAGDATTYLRIACLGISPLLLVLASTGVLRGLLDTRTPLVVAVAGSLTNVVLNLVLVHGVGGWAGLGLQGSALGSLLAQAAMATALMTVVVRGARRHGVSLRPRRTGVVEGARAGVPLVVRTLTLRAALVLTAYAVTTGSLHGGGVVEQRVDVAAHQLAMTIWTTLAFVLDAIAIAAQALTGRALGAGDRTGVRALVATLVGWSVGAGVVTGLGIAALAPLVDGLFTPDPAVADALRSVLWVVAIAQPLAGVVFCLDGILIGAGDGRYLAWGGVATLVVHAPLVLLVADHGLVAVWVVFSGAFMGARLLVLGLRARGDAWLVTGSRTT